MHSPTSVPDVPSRRATLAAELTRRTLRPVAGLLPANQVGLAVSRQIVARSMQLFGQVQPGTTVTPVHEHLDSGQVRGEWVVGPGATPPDGGAVLLYLHGSAYSVCSPRTHRGLVSHLSARTGLAAFSLDYRLAPRHRFPRAAHDVERAWDWLLSRSLPAERIVLAGDSAGGHLALDLCLALNRAGRPQPAAQLLFSPVADLTLELARERERARPDPMISAAGARRLIGFYTSGTDATHARLAHVVERHERLAPTLIQAGGREMLAADAHHLHRALRGSGTHCELEVWPGQMHVFQAMPRLIPEADPALRRAARFALDALDVCSPGIPARPGPAARRPGAHDPASWRSA
ncbi:MAG TPA: alpha/beta hydrolase [Pseudonocardia sp.]|nr:alpha/beta hydrolase [Pseudonocardia sp.]